MQPLIILLGLTAMITSAHAHSWYPKSCCSEADCAPVEKVEMAPGGRYMTTKHGRVFVPDSFKLYTYKNDKGEMVELEIPAHEKVRLHVCMSNGDAYDGYTAGGEMTPLCLFGEPGI